jgi:hypothetical protein
LNTLVFAGFAAVALAIALALAVVGVAGVLAFSVGAEPRHLIGCVRVAAARVARRAGGCRAGAPLRTT